MYSDLEEVVGKVEEKNLDIEIFFKEVTNTILKNLQMEK